MNTLKTLLAATCAAACCASAAMAQEADPNSASAFVSATIEPAITPIEVTSRGGNLGNLSVPREDEFADWACFYSVYPNALSGAPVRQAFSWLPSSAAAAPPEAFGCEATGAFEPVAFDITCDDAQDVTLDLAVTDATPGDGVLLTNDVIADGVGFISSPNNSFTPTGLSGGDIGFPATESCAAGGGTVGAHVGVLIEPTATGGDGIVLGTFTLTADY